MSLFVLLFKWLGGGMLHLAVGRDGPIADGERRLSLGDVLALVVIALVIGCLLWVWGLSVGTLREQTAQAARHAKELEQIQQRYREDVRAGELAAQALRGDLAQRDALIDSLKRKASHAPTFVATPECPVPGAVRLSLASVRLYDASLVGTDVGADPDGTAGPTTTADVADGDVNAPSEVTISTFKEVAQANAERLGQCAIRFNKLRAVVCARQECR